MARSSSKPAFFASSEASRRYELGEIIAAGGMGTVHRAYDRLGQREVAYKRMSAPDARTRARFGALFQREFDTLTHLVHPHIVEVYDYGFDLHGPYYTMELLSTDNLAKRAPLAFKQAARVLRDVASALALLHSRGLVHRDLSPRNVCLTADGHAKLIDFGTLCGFGRHSEMVGTAPFVAPETLKGGALDARTDLYALGALAYFLISGQPHVRARRFEELPDAWQERPLAPSHLIADLPEGCDELLLSLLEREPSARPESAAYVMERLTTLADLGPEHEPQRVALSYWLRPALIAREEPLSLLRAALEQTLRGKGQTLLISAEQGLGQTALLAQLAVESQMAGAIVLRAALGSYGGPFSAAHDLLHQGLALLPSVAERLRGRDSLFVRIEDSKAVREAALHSAIDASERAARISALLQEGLEALSDEAPVVLLIDGAHAVDAESIAWLAVVAEAARERPIMLVLSSTKGELWRDAVALGKLQSCGQQRELDALSAADLHALTVRTFGDAPNSAALSAWLFAETGGNPEHSVNLVRDLVHTGAVRYALGSFTLPIKPAHTAPSDRQSALLSRLVRGSAEAREVAALLSLQRGALRVEELALALEFDASKVVSALQELLRRGAVVASEEHYACASEALRAAIQTTLSIEQKRKLRRGLVRALGERGQGSLDTACAVAEHLLELDDHEQLEGALMLARAADEHAFELGMQTARVPVLERALAVLGKHGHDDRACVSLLVPLCLVAFFGEFAMLERYVARTLGSLYALCGIARAHSLRRYLGARLALLVGLVSAYIAHAVRPRGLCRRSFVQLVEFLTGVTGTSTAALACALDVQGAHDNLRGLEPLAAAPRSSPLFFMREFCVATAELVAVQLDSAERRYTSLLRTYERPVFGMTTRHRMQVRGGCVNGIAQAVVSEGLPRALELADRLEREGVAYAPHAEGIRATYYAYRGQIPRALRHRERAETLALRAGNSWSALSVITMRLIAPCVLSGDVIGLRRVTADLEQLSRLTPSLAVLHKLAEAHLAWLRGQPAEALARYEEVFADERARALPSYAAERALQVLALCALGQHERGRALAQTLIAEVDARGSAARNPLLYCIPRHALAVAEAELGDTSSAARTLDACLSRDLGPDNPFLLGMLHRYRAHVAAQAGDAAAFEFHFAAMQRWYEQTENPLLVAQCTRLEADAVRFGVRTPASSEPRRRDGAEAEAETSVERPGATDARDSAGDRTDSLRTS